MTTGTAEVGTLRVRSTAGDTPAVRLAAGAWLGGADLHPSELPPAAVLIVRRMADPLPGKLPSRGPEPPDSAWERAARASLGGFCRRAARPARGPVPADAEAVLFVDEAEMLACLALDLAQGNAFGRWWWTLVLRRPGARDLPRLLASEPARLPAILHHLAQEHRAAEICESLSETEAAAILETVARAYGLPGSAGVPPAGGREGKVPDPIEASAKPQTHPIHAPQPQWHQRLRAIPDVARLAPTNRILLAVALSLFEEPSRSRSPIFAAELREWWEEGAPLEPRTPYINKDASPQPSPPVRLSAAEPAPPVPKGANVPIPQKAPPTVETPRGASPRRQGPSDEPVGRSGATDQHTDQRTDQGATEAIAHPQGSSEGPRRSGDAPRGVSTVGGKDRGIGTSAPLPDDRLPAAAPVGSEVAEPAAEGKVEAVEEASALVFEDGVATEIAGLFYLINLMTSLDLPDCFEEDWRLASEVGAWGVLDAIARALLADAPHLEADPVWRLLAVLAGREPDEPPGLRYARTGQLRVPEAWPVLHGVEHAPHEGSQQRQGVQRGRLDGQQQRQGVQRQRQDGQQQRQEVQRQRLDGQQQRLDGQQQRQEVQRQRLEAERGPLGVERGALTRWLGLVLPYLRLRLAQGLRLDPERPEDLPPLLLLCPGRLYVTSTHVDIVMDLASIALPVRISGLDRDPGWVPAFGRVVQFHFR